jgi:hypothetical protein
VVRTLQAKRGPVAQERPNVYGRRSVGGASLGGAREAWRSAYEVAGQDVHPRRFDRDAPISVTFTPDLQDGTVCDEPDVDDIGTHQLIGS